MATRVNNVMPDNFSNEARMMYFMLDRADEQYPAGDLDECKDRCLTLLQQPRLPRFARAHTLMLMAAVVDLCDIDGFLDAALAVCDEMQVVEPSDPLIAPLRDRIEELRQHYNKEKERAAAKREAEADSNVETDQAGLDDEEAVDVDEGQKEESDEGKGEASETSKEDVA